MRVAIDTGPLTSGDKIRGVGFYTKHLIDALSTSIAKENRKKKSMDKLSLTLLDSESIKRSAHEFDLIHIPYFSPYFFTIPTGLDTKIVVTIHDVIPLLYPDKYLAGIKGGIRFIRQKRAVKDIDLIITDSEASKKDIIKYLEVSPEIIVPIYLAPAKHFKKIKKKKLKVTKKKYGLPPKFVLYVGDINYNKNIPTLIKACDMAKVPLVIVGKQANDIEVFESDIQYLHGPRDWVRFLFGKPHPEISHYKDLMTAFQSGQNIVRPGFVTDEELVHLYNLATVYCQPSFAEGFGLPVLEAMASKVPVVASRCQCLVEVAGNAALFANPKSAKEFAEHFKSLFSSKRNRDTLVKKGTKHVSNYSWEKTARETMKSYQDVFEGK